MEDEKLGNSRTCPQNIWHVATQDTLYICGGHPYALQKARSLLAVLEILRDIAQVNPKNRS